jgi:hypothetical protein
MILTDTWIVSHLLPGWSGVVGATEATRLQAYNWLRYAVEAVLVLGVFYYGWSRRRVRREPAPAA